MTRLLLIAATLLVTVGAFAQTTLPGSDATQLGFHHHHRGRHHHRHA